MSTHNTTLDYSLILSNLHEYEADTYQGAVSVRSHSAAEARRVIEDDMGIEVESLLCVDHWEDC